MCTISGSRNSLPIWSTRVHCLGFGGVRVFISICDVEGSSFIYVICIYLPILVSNAISISDDVRVIQQQHAGCHL